MKESDKYLKIVEWSKEDSCYIGSVPGWLDSVVTVMMKLRFTKNFVKLLMSGLRFTKKRIGLCLRQPTKNTPGSLF